MEAELCDRTYRQTDVTNIKIYGQRDRYDEDPDIRPDRHDEDPDTKTDRNSEDPDIRTDNLDDTQGHTDRRT